MITFLTMFILTHPVNFPCGKKPEHPEKTHDFRQSVDWLFSHESVVRMQPTNSEVKGGVWYGEILLTCDKRQLMIRQLHTEIIEFHAITEAKGIRTNHGAIVQR